MISWTTHNNGRLGNQIIRNLAVSKIAEKHNLKCMYSNNFLIKELGIELFTGNNTFNNFIDLRDENYFEILNQHTLNSNLNPNNNYFQTKDITNFLYNYLHSDKIKNNIIDKNIFKERYNNNKDLFIHIRLDDIASYNPGVNYYLKAISKLSFDNIYISTDSKNHPIIEDLIKNYENSVIIDYDEIKTIQFGSTCKNVILSHGSFSAIIGYLSFFSNIHFPEYDENKIWYGDMFSIEGWNKIIYQ